MEIDEVIDTLREARSKMLRVLHFYAAISEEQSQNLDLAQYRVGILTRELIRELKERSPPEARV